MHQPVAHPVQRLQVELVVGLDRHKPHVLPRHRLGDRLRIEEVVLVRLEKGFYKLRRDQPHIVSLFTQDSADEMRARAGFDPNQQAWQVRRVDQQLLAGELRPGHNLAMVVQGDEVKGGLAEVDSNRRDLHMMILRF